NSCVMEREVRIATVEDLQRRGTIGEVLVRLHGENPELLDTTANKNYLLVERGPAKYYGQEYWEIVTNLGGLSNAYRHDLAANKAYKSNGKQLSANTVLGENSMDIVFFDFNPAKDRKLLNIL